MKLTQKYIWDYDVSKLDLSDPEVLCWYLQRKIECGDWEALDKETLREYLPKLDINPYLRRILTSFLKEND